MLKRPFSLIISIVVLFFVFTPVFFGAKIAREKPEILNYISFNNGPFSWQYAYKTGHVNPFFVGMKSRNVFHSALKSDDPFYYGSMDDRDLYFKIEDKSLLKFQNSIGAKNGEINLRKISLGTYVNYILYVENCEVKKIVISGSLFSGL